LVVEAELMLEVEGGRWKVEVDVEVEVEVDGS
jgi:hypothetical protein